ncbi:MAG: glycosyltransferase [Bacteroidales bacterium]|nr:glycosyltransferase [Bacteroidales bacterium]
MYILMVWAFYIGWLKTPVYHPQNTASIPVTILVACRNESGRIQCLFDGLSRQNYPVHLWEVIFIDDHSTDQTVEEIRKFQHAQPNCRLISLPEYQSGKKAALVAGQELANGSLFLFTDADCSPSPGWISTMASFFNQYSSDLLLGPVMIDPVASVKDHLQKLEYMSLMASSSGACGLGHPIMAHAPNMGVRREIYRTFCHALDTRFASGDDVFLLQALKKESRNKIHFVKTREALVSSKPAGGLPGFFSQRRRWASKAKGYTDPALVLVTLTVFILNTIIVAAALGSCFGFFSPRFLLILFGIKTAADLPLMAAAMQFYHFNKGWWVFLPLQIIYSPYVVLVGIISLFGKYSWKGRKIP